MSRVLVHVFNRLFLFVCSSYGPGEDDVASGGISSDNKPRIVLMGLRR